MALLWQWCCLLCSLVLWAYYQALGLSPPGELLGDAGVSASTGWANSDAHGSGLPTETVFSRTVPPVAPVQGVHTHGWGSALYLATTAPPSTDVCGATADTTDTGATVGAAGAGAGVGVGAGAGACVGASASVDASAGGDAGAGQGTVLSSSREMVRGNCWPGCGPHTHARG